MYAKFRFFGQVAHLMFSSKYVNVMQKLSNEKYAKQHLSLIRDILKARPAFNMNDTDVTWPPCVSQSLLNLKKALGLESTFIR